MVTERNVGLGNGQYIYLGVFPREFGIKPNKERREQRNILTPLLYLNASVRKGPLGLYEDWSLNAMLAWGTASTYA